MTKRIISLKNEIQESEITLSYAMEQFINFKTAQGVADLTLRDYKQTFENKTLTRRFKSGEAAGRCCPPISTIPKVYGSCFIRRKQGLRDIILALGSQLFLVILHQFYNLHRF